MANISGSLSAKATLAEVAPTGVMLGLGASASLSLSLRYANGTGPAQADLIYYADLALSSPLALDLTALPGASGMARVREMIVIVTDTNPGDRVAVSAASSNGWAFLPPPAHSIPVMAGSGLLHFSDNRSTGPGIGYVAGSGSKNIVIDPGANTVNCSITILGCSAAS